MDNILITNITFDANLTDLKSLFEIKCKNSISSFTYFKNRSYEVIKNHLVTNLMYLNGEAVGYSHLDVDGDQIWFGICIADSCRGKGLGEKLINHTLLQASKNNVKKILLSVYKDNSVAINLYTKVGFKVFKETEKSFFMVKEI
jgi:ribosomal protein S18 acetylase RimI-like enzyme